MAHGLSDTDKAIEAKRIAGLRNMTPAQRLALAGSMTRNVRQLALTGIRLRYPGIEAREEMFRLAALSVDRTTVVRAFGWDPDRAAPPVGDDDR